MMIISQQVLSCVGLSQGLQGVHMIPTHCDLIEMWVVGHWRVLEEGHFPGRRADFNRDFWVVNALIHKTFQVPLIGIRLELLE
jgi:hypothetical protein